MIYYFFSEALTLIFISRVALRLAQHLKNSTLFATFFEGVCQNGLSTIVIVRVAIFSKRKTGTLIADCYDD